MTIFRVVAAAGVLVLASGCATVAPSSGATVAAVETNPADPWERFNRKVFVFNEALDRDVMKPVAETYRKVVPQPVRTGVNNVLGNLYDVWSTANQLLQGKLQNGVEMGMRVATNTFFGIGGILDPATEMGLTRKSEDFGQTLGRWGLGSGPYLVLPVLGPSTLRDTGGLVVDRMASPSVLGEGSGATAITGIEVVNTRSNLLEAGNLVDQVALDKYSFFRDAYLSRRRDAVYDGAPPMETFADDGADAAPAAGAAAPVPGAAASAPAARANTPPAALAPAASAPRK